MEGGGANGGAPVLPDALTPEDLVARFGLRVNRTSTCFVIKETSVDFKGLHWLQRFLRHNAKDYRVRVVWPLRSYRHTYLSFVEGAREWWGHEDMQVDVESYDKWVQRADKATGLIHSIYQEFQGAVFSYESLSADLPSVLPLLMDALGLSFNERQLDYRKHMAQDQVRGDRGVAENPRPVSDSSTQARETEWLVVESQLAQSRNNTRRALLDACWSAINHQQVWNGALPLGKLLSGHDDVDGASLARENGLLIINPSTEEYRLAFRSRDQWQRFIKSQVKLANPGKIRIAGEEIARKGFVFRAGGVLPTRQKLVGENLRESFVHDGLNGRKRAVLMELLGDLRRRGIGINDASIYAPEALGGFARYLAREFPRFRGSEYIPDPAVQAKLSPVEHQDLASLTFDDSAFDYVLVNDIFEHVPDLSPVLSEIRRVLRPGGSLLSTFPFAFKREQHLVKAVLRPDGDIDYLTDPEYHEDPVDDRGVLVFQVPGWQILEDARDAGFEDASMVYVSSPSHAVMASYISGVMVLRATRSA